MSEVMIAAEIDRLAGLSLSTLREEWHRAFPDRLMPRRLARDFLVRTISWKLQEETHGRLATAVERKLDRYSDQIARSGTFDLERETLIKPGTTLLREWGGETHRVVALEEGFLYANQRFSSLSEIARLIAGTRWSGPRFFGLKQGRGRGRGISRHHDNG